MGETTILQKISINSKVYPDRIALKEFSSETIRTLTWGELGLYSDRLAFYLSTNHDDKLPVIVYGHKSPLMIVCFLACLKSGRAYCPVDVNVPEERVIDIINEVDPSIILANEELHICDDRIKNSYDIKSIIDETQDTISDCAFAQKEDVYYIIFTSGSTGAPKGVQITGECLDNFIKWAITLGNGCEDGEHNVLLIKHPFPSIYL